MQLVMGMLSPEQQEMFEMYQTMFSQTDEPAADDSPSGNADPPESGRFGQTPPEVRIQEDHQQHPEAESFPIQEDGQRESGLNDFPSRKDGQRESGPDNMQI